MSIILSGISFRYTNQHTLFEDLDLSVATGGKASVVGNNGTGKSTLLRLIAGRLDPLAGNIACSSTPYYIPQHIDISGTSVAGALGIDAKIRALQAICAGSTDVAHYDALQDDWDVESRCLAALDHWGLGHVALTAPVETLSGGEKTRLFLAGVLIHEPAIILLDEPTNHLDRSGRYKLYDFIRTSRATMLVVSHDIALLNLLDMTCELSAKGLRLYGGNYDFYNGQKQLEEESLDQQITSEQAALRLALRRSREVRERQEKRMRQGERNKDQLPRILRKTMKDSGERTNARLGDKHAGLIDDSRRRLDDMRLRRRERCELKIDFEDAQLHEGKMLVAVRDVNFAYTEGSPLWSEPLELEIRSGERIRIAGDNGSGKTTLLKLITGELDPTSGRVDRAGFSHVYLDQEYSKVSTTQTVLELAQGYNHGRLQDHELKTRLHRALFPREKWDSLCNTLSGGERMRLYLCCLMISNHLPDLFILDEPTNNLDLSSLAILTHTIRNYRGTLLVISHDVHFADAVGIERTIDL